MGNFNNELKNWQQIPKLLINDNSLSDRARFVYCFMACKPDDWDFFMQPLAKDLGYSVDTLRKYINELIESGWLSKGKQTRKADNTWGATEYILHAQKVQRVPDTEIFRHGENTAQYNTDIDIKSYMKEKEDTIVSKKGDIDYDLILNSWNNIADNVLGISKIKSLTDGRKKQIKKLITKCKTSVDEIVKLINTIPYADDWVLGKGDKNWIINFDFLMKNTSNWYIRALEGDMHRKNRYEFDKIMNGECLSLHKENSDTPKFQF